MNWDLTAPFSETWPARLILLVICLLSLPVAFAIAKLIPAFFLWEAAKVERRVFDGLTMEEWIAKRKANDDIAAKRVHEVPKV